MSNDHLKISSLRRKSVDQQLDNAVLLVRAAQSEDSLSQADTLLQQALELMRDKSEPMIYEDHEACWQHWVSVKELVRAKRKELCDINYADLKHAAGQARALAYNSPREARQSVRDIYDATTVRLMESWQFDEIRAMLNEIYSTVHATARQQHEEFLTKLMSARSRKLELIEKNSAMISHIEQQIERCRDLLSDGRTPEYQSRLGGWIDEKRGKLRDLERLNRELEDQLGQIDTTVEE